MPLDVQVTVTLNDAQIAILGTITKDIPGYLTTRLQTISDGILSDATTKLRATLHDKINQAPDTQLGQVAQSFGVVVSG